MKTYLQTTHSNLSLNEKTDYTLKSKSGFFTSIKIAMAAVLYLCSLTLFSQQVYTFTNAGATGQTGPSQAQLNAAYSSTTLAGQVTSSAGIQLWQVPISGIYRIQAAGAKGGGANNFGKGAIIEADVLLNAGQVLKIMVGQSGNYNTSVNGSGSGGGGTFVATNTNVPIVVAGGGGGQYNSSSSLYNANAVTTNSGLGTGCPNSGGANGNGGPGCTNSGAAGGGGFYTNATNGTYGTGGYAFVNGGVGGNHSAYAECIGGFGGGGGTHGNTGGGGGGGGYSGGGGGYHSTANGSGGGGGSFTISSTMLLATSNGLYNSSSTFNGDPIGNLNAYNSGNGYVKFTVISTGSADIEAIDIVPVTNSGSMCQYIEHDFDITLKNNGPDDASFINFKVYMEGMDTVEILFYDIRDLLNGTTKTYRISSSKLVPQKVGNYPLYLNITKVLSENDDPLNNIVSSNEVVNPTPYDSEFVPVLPFDGRIDLGIFNYPDMTNSGKEIVYEIKTPTGFTNGGANWSVSNISTSLSGNPLPPGFFTLSTHTAGSNAKLKVKFPDSYEDSNVILKVKLTSNFGCEAIITRHVYIAATVKTKFSFSSSCALEPMIFTNLSTLSKGVPKYIWYFGDGSDSMETFSDPQHTYSLSGTYDVTLVGITDLGFRTDTTITISVTPTPIANFTFTNACLGESIELKEDASISSGTLNYTWTLGDGNTSNQQDVSHQYTTHGMYEVNLYVESQLGCNANITKQVQQHPLPVADFVLPGTPQCFDAPIAFTNQSTIPYTNIGYDWKMEDGTIYKSVNSSHTFNAAGSYDVKLLATSEFGCMDSISKSIFILPTPIVDFNVIETCLNSEALMTSTSNVVGGQNITYTWKTGDGMMLNGMQAQHTYSALGNYTVELEVNFDNGCSDNMSKQIIVNERPVAGFEVLPVCEGEATYFVNTSTNVNGVLSNNWQLGDGNNSTDFNPVHIYSTTGTYNVVLITSTGTSCTDTFTVIHNVNEMPVCDFDWAIDWTAGYEPGKRSIKFTPDNTTYDSYKWYFGNVGNMLQTSPTYKFPVDGTVSVRLVAKTAAGCECESIESIFVGTTGLPLVETGDIKFYPNPAIDYLNVENLTANGKSLSYQIMDQTGRTLQTGNLNQGINRIELGAFANGTYYISMTSDGVTGTYPFVVLK